VIIFYHRGGVCGFRTRIVKAINEAVSRESIYTLTLNSSLVGVNWQLGVLAELNALSKCAPAAC
jgi:hypothetical protein